MARKIGKLMAHRGVPWVAAALMLVLFLTALRTGFVADDYYQRTILLGEGGPAGLDDPLMECVDCVVHREALLRQTAYSS